MSSNISVIRRCECCEQEFIAKTTVTRFCSEACNRKSYKDRLRTAKIQQSNQETSDRKILSKSTLLEKELLTVKDVAEITESSTDAIYYLINSGKLPASRITARKTRIFRQDLWEFLKLPDAIVEPGIRKKVEPMSLEDTPLTLESTYGIKHLVTLFEKSREDLYTYLKRHQVPKIKVGKEVYYSKEAIDKLHRKSKEPKYLGHEKERLANIQLAKKGLKISDCYSMEECELMLKAKRSNLYNIFSRRMVPKIRQGQLTFYSKKAVDRIVKNVKEGGEL